MRTASTCPKPSSSGLAATAGSTVPEKMTGAFETRRRKAALVADAPGTGLGGNGKLVADAWAQARTKLRLARPREMKKTKRK